jgi:hypothetical protein
MFSGHHIWGIVPRWMFGGEFLQRSSAPHYVDCAGKPVFLAELLDVLHTHNEKPAL